MTIHKRRIILAGEFCVPWANSQSHFGAYELAVNKIPRYTVEISTVLGVAMSIVIAEIEAKIRSLSREDKTELIRDLIENGYATLPQSPGIGFEAQSELFAVMKSLVPDA